MRACAAQKRDNVSCLGKRVTALTVFMGRTQVRRGQLPDPEDFVADALGQQLGSDKSSGRSSLDKRFRWKLLQGNAAGAGKSSVEECDVPNLDYEAFLGDGFILNTVSKHLKAAVDASTHGEAKVVVTGSTGARLCAYQHPDRKAARLSHECISSAFPVSDIDMEVRVPPSSADVVMAQAVAAVDRVCARMIDDAILQMYVKRVCSAQSLDVDKCKTNSRIITHRLGTADQDACQNTGEGADHDNGQGRAISIDVPRFSRVAPRLHYTPLFATRNDTFKGTILHRLRLSCSAAGRRRSYPLVDIKTLRSDTSDVRYTSVPVFGTEVTVPSLESMREEIRRLLAREYRNVDTSKDERRRLQKDVFDRLLSASLGSFCWKTASGREVRFA